MHRIIRAICCVFCCALGVARAADIPSDTRFAIRSWDTDEGLPESSIFAIAQTPDGYLWLGTFNGLVRFDGLGFTVFDSRNTPGLKDSRISSLFADSMGALWIGTESGAVIVMRSGRFTLAELGPIGSDRRLLSACEDAEHGVWLLKKNRDIWRFDGQRFTPFVLEDEPATARCIIQEPKGPIWIATDQRQCAVIGGPENTLQLPVIDRVPGGVDLLVPSRDGGYWRLADRKVQHWTTNQLDRNYGAYAWPPFVGNPAVRTCFVTAACETSDGDLVVGTEALGLFLYDRTSRTVTRIDTRDGLSYNYISALYTDREGTLWVGTQGGGLNRLKPQIFKTLAATRGTIVQSLAEGADGALWVASRGDGIIKIVSPDESVVTDVGSETNVSRFTILQNVFPFVASVLVDRQERVWAGTLGAGLRLLKGSVFTTEGGGVIPFSVPQGWVTAIFQDSSNRLWFGTANGLACLENTNWSRFTTAQGLPSDSVSAIAEMDGDLWIGTQHGGICRLHAGKFMPAERPPGTEELDVAGLLVEKNGVLWVSTVADGLLRYADGKWVRYTTREGLVSNSLGYLLDSEEDLWIGSKAGVLRMKKQDLAEVAAGRGRVVPCRAYGKAEGLPTRECSSGSQPGAMRDSRGRYWFPTTKGLAFLDPARLRVNTNPPPVSIESVLVDHEPMASQGDITVHPSAERIEINFASVNLSAPEKTLFRYRLEGHETEWTEVADTRVARYSRLSPGNYTFHVIACNEDGVWNERGAVLGLIVQPPIWRTWWFLTALTLGVIGGIAGAVHLVSTQRYQRELAVLRQQEALEKERARIARDIHDQVGASLTQVALLGELVEADKNSPPDIEEHAQQISQTARETTRALDEIVWTVNPSNDTVESLVNYICKYAQDYLGVANIKYRLDVPAEVPAIPIAPDVRHNVFLATKEAITNVVRHAQATSAWVRVRLGDSGLLIEVEDNGRGLGSMDPQRAKTRHGLSNMRKRMEEIGGQFSLDPGSEGGAVARLTVPIKAQNVGT